MLTTVEKLLFFVLIFISLYAAYVTFGRMIRTVLRGQGRIVVQSKSRFIADLLLAFLNQGGIIQRRRVASLFHYGVAWGFLFYILVNVVDVLEAYVPGFRFLGETAVGGVYRFAADVFSVAVLVGVVYFAVRRFLARDRALTVRDNVKLFPNAAAGISRDSLIVVAFIFFHVGFRFLGQSFLVAQEGADAWQPFATLMSNLWSGLSEGGLGAGWHISWWLALGLILMFLPYFPYTKHAHLFMGPVNIASRPKRRSPGALDALDFEDESIEQFGAARLTDLSQTQVLDAFACIMCNRCQDACPAYVTGKELSPAALEINKRFYTKHTMAALATGGEDEDVLLDYAISESAVWACTACGACVEVCPVGNEPMFDILHIRQNQVLMESAFPGELKAAFNGMERMANPWGMTEDRLAWAAVLDFEVPTVEQNPDFEVLYWVGCAGAFDPNAQEIARAMATLLHSAGVNYAVLGNEESCTGDSARRAGNEYLFFEMAMMNIEVLNGIGADKKTIVTTCPHCFHTLGKEYADLGGDFRVLHHTQYIGELIGTKKLSLRNGRVLEQATFHDPCYLGRQNGEYEAPRKALAEAGMALLEMDHNRAGSFCCGAGGAQMWKEEEHGQASVSATRYAEARQTGANVLATGCPFCAIMMKDANVEAGEIMQVKDVAQVVAEVVS
ncbi:MAG: (Fe-S)-binding protein [Chloroflexota bacterium]|jgi:Fe-S oxidoreductase